jgi:predicted transcriptional regulator
MKQTKPQNKVKPLQSRVPEDVVDELKIVAIKEHTTLEQVVTDALRDFVARYKESPKQTAGAGQ